MPRNHLTWDEHRHSIGFAALDAQHRHMIDLINRISDMLGDAGQIENAWKTMDEFLVFTQEHFAYEEQLMMQHDYPDAANHVEEHRKQLEQMSNLVREAGNSPYSVRARLVPAFLADWAEQHILHEDRKLGAFLAGNGEQT